MSNIVMKIVSPSLKFVSQVLTVESKWADEKQKDKDYYGKIYISLPPITNIGFLRVFNQLVRTEQIDLMGEQHERFLGLFVSLVVCLKQLRGFNGTPGNYHRDWLAAFAGKSQAAEKVFLYTILCKIFFQNCVKTWKVTDTRVLLWGLYCSKIWRLIKRSD